MDTHSYTSNADCSPVTALDPTPIYYAAGKSKVMYYLPDASKFHLLSDIGTCADLREERERFNNTSKL